MPRRPRQQRRYHPLRIYKFISRIRKGDQSYWTSPQSTLEEHQYLTYIIQQGFCNLGTLVRREATREGYFFDNNRGPSRASPEGLVFEARSYFDMLLPASAIQENEYVLAGYKRSELRDRSTCWT